MTDMADHLTSAVELLPPTLILWDVDHTLIENGGVSKDTYALAYELIVGSAPQVRPTTHGRTDFQIMTELLTANSADTSGFTEIKDFAGFLVDAMAKTAPSLPTRGHALPGAREALLSLAKNPNIIQSALTGNIYPNAISKLAAFDLDRLIDMEVGGYGSDDKVRSNLVDAARSKVAKKYGKSFDTASTILIGDTPLDVRAALDGGAQIVAVASGVHAAQELRDAGATAVLEDLSSTEALVEAIASIR